MSKQTIVPEYQHQEVEKRLQSAWELAGLFQNVPEVVGAPEKSKKKFHLFAFAYPSGAGLHVGHVESMTALDILSRHSRMQGNQVYFPVGWDAFGLPAENYAIKTGIPPAKTTYDAIHTFRRQIKRLGISYDWANEIATSHPEYYRWTQWLFLQLYRKGLAYKDIGMVNWCPSCQTVLANEQVVNGQCERCDTAVVQKELVQWYFKITAYTEELLSGLDDVDWPTPTKQQQRHWIGKSSGVEIDFSLDMTSISNAKVDANIQAKPEILTCFTTRIDTVFGVTFVVISPEKWQSLQLQQYVTADLQKSVEEYVTAAFRKTEEERKIGEKDKTGVNTGLLVINPITGKSVPLFVADYVLAGYGTGIVMGVPAHDDRDESFAKKFQLPIVQVVNEDNCLVNSGEFSGQSSAEARANLTNKFTQFVRPTVNYKLRDWLISRQRYWGAPIPVVYDPEGNAHPVKEEHLPWLLPEDVDFKPTGESPLKSSKEFIERTERLYGKGWRPEFDTMDTFVDSSWYYLRYCDSRNTAVFADPDRLKSWLPVDMYLIGPEHIVLHLLYSRFFTKFLRDEGYLNINEPFQKMRHQGMILGPDGRKMSKSKGNVINPDEVIENFGADTLRVYEMFMGPLESDKPWDIRAVAGVSRFLKRFFSLVVHEQLAPKERSISEQLTKKLHQTVEKVTEDIPALKFNTAIAAMMELVNLWESEIKKQRWLGAAGAEMAVRVLAPFAPFMSEELWQQHLDVSHKESIHLQSWPVFDPKLTAETELVLAVQVNGKLRGELRISAGEIANQAQVITQSKQLPSVLPWIKDRQIVREIYITGKIVSLVVDK